MKIGDYVKITNMDEVYDTYFEWAKDQGLDRYDYCTWKKGLDHDRICRVIAMAPHACYDNTYLLGIENDDGDQYIINENAVMLVNGVDKDGNNLHLLINQIKPFQRVVIRRGITLIVVPNIQKQEYPQCMLAGLTDYGSLIELNMAQKMPEYDIMEVYDMPSANNQLMDFNHKGQLLWKRIDRPTKEMLDQINKLEKEIKEQQEYLTELKKLYEIK